MSRILFVLLCCFALEVQAIVMTPGQPEQQVEKQTVTSKPAAPATHAKPVVRTSKAPAPKQAPLPPLSRATIGFCQTINSYTPNYDMMEMYLQQGADINGICDKNYHMTALSMVAVSNLELASWLIQHGADVNIPVEDNQASMITLVMRSAHATQTGQSINPKLLDLLIQNSANVKTLDSRGRTPLHYFNRYNNLWPVVQSDYTNTFVDFFDKLVSHGIDVNHQDNSGNTALMDAARGCAAYSVKLLLAYGARPEIKDKVGSSALDIAIDRATKSGQGSSCNEVVKILSNSQSVPSRTPSAKNASPNLNAGLKTSDSQTQGAASFAGSYSGTYNGSDSGSFQVDIAQDGTAKLSGRSSKMGVSFTGDGKVSRDGSVALGSASTGSTFTGSVNSTGLLSGTWKNTAYNQAGSFRGSKGAASAANPLEAIGAGLQLLNNILKPR